MDLGCKYLNESISESGICGSYKGIKPGLLGVKPVPLNMSSIGCGAVSKSPGIIKKIEGGEIAFFLCGLEDEKSFVMDIV
jgi:hypothetical protein